ncbi:hypothetical protein NLI96_g7011 [Meripilus lineatus]|uniref:Homeobox domain-containing protein n=1 Tax=Meripilus lineatus TaxID=2056292 RepID=A0AAD5UZX0_9APHY|nr:hypothetical protein NLI96_g7011 [Physisporinus lineatus]
MAKKPSSRKSRTPHATGQVTREIMGSRKKRVRMTAAQLRVLLPMFALEPNPTQETREELATQLNIPYLKVDTWFRNRRSKVGRLFYEEIENKAPKEVVINETPLIGRGSNTLCGKCQEIGYGEDDELREAAELLLGFAQRGVIFGSKDKLGMITSTSTDGR